MRNPQYRVMTTIQTEALAAQLSLKTGQLDKMALSELGAYAIFAGYFGLIAFSFAVVCHSTFKGVKVGQVFEGRAFLFLRTALGALLCTWYCESAKIYTACAGSMLTGRSHDQVHAGQ